MNTQQFVIYGVKKRDWQKWKIEDFFLPELKKETGNCLEDKDFYQSKKKTERLAKVRDWWTVWRTEVQEKHLEHLGWLLSFCNVGDLGFAVAFSIPDQRGDLSHLLLLEDIGLRANPGHNGLEAQQVEVKVKVMAAQ